MTFFLYTEQSYRILKYNILYKCFKMVGLTLKVKYPIHTYFIYDIHKHLFKKKKQYLIMFLLLVVTLI